MRLDSQMSSSYSWTKVDALNLPSNLSADDICLYYLVYTPAGGYEASDANQWVLNYKIPIQRLRDNPQRRHYKEKAIHDYACAIINLVRTIKVDDVSISGLHDKVGVLPVPPSKAQDDKDYDNRTLKTAMHVCNQTGFRLCDDIETTNPIMASHSGGTRDPQIIEQTLSRVALDANKCDWLFIVDDVLVSGAHFIAINEVLKRTGFHGEVIGLFLARSIAQDL